MSIRPTQPSTKTLASPVAENRLAAVLAAGHKAKDKFRTGKCYKVTSPKVITATFFAKFFDEPETKRPFMSEYELAELNCEDKVMPKVSIDETVKVVNVIREMANYQSQFFENGEVRVRMHMPRSEDSYLMTLKHNPNDKMASIHNYLSASGMLSVHLKETDAFIRLQAFLSENYDNPYGPLILLDGERS